MKYLSFSLWGDKPIYNIGSIRNAELCKTIYPDWQMVLYYDDSVPSETIKKLTDLNVKLINMSSSKLYGVFWRFLAADLLDTEYAVFRDCDSRISLREKSAVDEWMKSGKTLHLMRDHPYHRVPYGGKGLGILGGMWGIKGGKINITKMIEGFSLSNQHEYGNDQTFLVSIYEMFTNDKITHDDFFENKPFPTKRIPGEFVGGRISEFDKPVGNDYKLVL